MANIRAFQACDESSILSARTKEKDRIIDTVFFFGFVSSELNSHQGEQSEPTRVR